jgi:outer membrane protein OmpA-like peptidoglycan-associated protein
MRSNEVTIAVWASLTGMMTAAADTPPVVQHVPLCPGLRIVTAISQKEGDYESIKTLETVNAESQRLKYSTEHMTADIFSNDPPKLEKITIYRRILVSDLQNALVYAQVFTTVLPEAIPGTTAIGTSTKLLKALKSKSQADFGFFLGIPIPTGTIPADHSTHPNAYDFQVMGKLHRIEQTPVMLPVIVNDVPSVLPAVHAAGTFFGDRTEFYFLDDPTNPLTLKFRYGIDAVTAIDPAGGKPMKKDKDDLLVTKMAYQCTDTPLVNPIEQQLSANGKAEIYDIYFSFNSDQIREESESSLKEIAEALAHHPDWKLAVNGHTDNLGSDPYNLSLSRKRSEAVKGALVSRYRIDASRLSTDGFGASQPQDTNVTLEGRAHNRRVELIKR